MFDQIGKKIKALAKVIFWIGAIPSFIAGCVVMGSDLDLFGQRGGGAAGFLVGLLVIAVGVLISWLNSVLLYGFGELIDTNQELNQKMGFLLPVIKTLQTGNDSIGSSGGGTSPRPMKEPPKDPFSEMPDDL